MLRSEKRAAQTFCLRSACSDQLGLKSGVGKTARPFRAPTLDRKREGGLLAALNQSPLLLSGRVAVTECPQMLGDGLEAASTELEANIRGADLSALLF